MCAPCVARLKVPLQLCHVTINRGWYKLKMLRLVGLYHLTTLAYLNRMRLHKPLFPGCDFKFLDEGFPIV